jgi:hypothetical protein
MKILGGDSVSDLADGIMQNLPLEIRSRIEGGGESVKKPAGEVVTQPAITSNGG